MAEEYILPVLPLRDTVVYPGVAVPISAGRPGTVEAVQRALDGDRRLFAVAQRENLDEATPELLYSVGTVVRIIQTHRVRGGVQLLVQGENRAEVVSYQSTGDSMLEASLSDLERKVGSASDDHEFDALNQELRSRAAELGAKRGVPTEALNQLIQAADEPGAFADLVSFYLELPTEDKQELLETLNDEKRMRAALIAVERELARLDAQEEIQAKVQEELGERQREMLLREQLKQIQRELGEEDERDDVDELRERLESLKLGEEQRAEVDRELKRLMRTSPQAAEYQVIRTFLEWVTELPWGDRSDEKIDLAVSEDILNEDHYGLEDVKDRVLEFLAVCKLQQDRSEETEGSESRKTHEEEAKSEDSVSKTVEVIGRAPILLFVGPPGVGKTSIAQSVARSLGREYVRISLGGARDEADIRGHRRTYVGAMPGRILQGMRTAKTKNPVFLLDEVDKLGVSFQGDPSAALLEVLDPEQNGSFADHYLGMPFDLSEVLFIATANYADRIPAPLYDRMEKVDFSGYTEAEKLEIAKRYLLPRQEKENGLREKELILGDKGLLSLIQEYTREAGVRQIERELGKLARKVARKIAAGETQSIKATKKIIRELMGRPRVHPERMALVDTVGVATGMFYTPMGGDIMFVEVSTMSGEGGLVLTGQLGDVMKESGRAALSFAKSNHQQLGIPSDSLKGKEIHIHVPAGAVPKDGPSAGITMATALISTLCGHKVRKDIAMTGELTLTGRVLPIGGVKEKLLGAVRAGIHTIIIPKANEVDLEDLKEDVRKKITVHLVEDLSQVIDLALTSSTSSSKGKKGGGRGKTTTPAG
ncbi:MAG: endopeptidase La [Gemmatimonadetes bacterium]|nr:endopeptidase La [Gemmatimonadota bacterium]